jgi:dipeptidyl aminopeptidase/acylaminoacyl peptidase
MSRNWIATLALALTVATIAAAAVESPKPPDAARHFTARDVFELEWASDPRFSPDGTRVAYVRNFMDIMSDRRRSSLWVVDVRTGEQRPLTDGASDTRSPRWSPDGGRLLYVSSGDGGSQIHVRWMDSGQSTPISRLTESPSDLAWSPDGKSIAFSMLVPAATQPMVTMPDKPEGAHWADPPRVIDRLVYRVDGAGYLPEGYNHLFVLPAEGGTPRQVTSGDFDHGSTPVWTPDGKALLFSANRHEDADYRPLDSEIYEVDLQSGAIRALTDRRGPDESPRLSPDGRSIAYLGFDDRYQGYQVTHLYLMSRDGSEPHDLTPSLDRDVESPQWGADGRGLYFLYDDRGNTKVGYVSREGAIDTLAGDVGGLDLGRPYSGGQLSVAPNGSFAFTQTRPDHPADLAVGSRASGVVRLTRLNEDLFSGMELATVEEIDFTSSFDGRPLQGWLVEPPGFSSERRYPLILEIHGGPFANYGDRFAAEIQLYAAAGYEVLYLNPRGSTSYGEEFGNLIHHNYPSQDYDDLMSGVDAVLERGTVDPNQLFVTGGSGGGVLTAWIVGKTDRFRAAVSAKPVINWASFALTSDFPNFFYRYWFSGFPWDEPEEYLRRSPLFQVGNVKTPTMLITGERDFRTPSSEAEQFYEALKLRKIDTALVRIPGASHGIANRPSQLVAKALHVLAWFERYRGPRPAVPAEPVAAAEH